MLCFKEHNTCVVEDGLTFQESQRQSENCVEEHSETHQGTESYPIHITIVVQSTAFEYGST